MILHGARVALGPDAAAELDIEIRGARIHALRKPSKASSRSQEVDLSGRLILPGLINAHDHLEFSTFPRLGRGPYPNAGAWARDVYRPDESPVKEQLAIPKRVRLMWGGLINVGSGVTTVCHHNPWYGVFERKFPVRVVKRLGWAHSLEYSKDVAERYRQTPPEWPFILHLGEGTDRKSKREIFELDALGALGPNTVLTHAVALAGRGLRLAKERGAALIWCPSSNLFLLGRTLSTKTLSSGIPIALGTDSTLTSKGNLLDELRVARAVSGLSGAVLYRMVTEDAARILRLRRGEGTLVAGGVADLIALPDAGRTPAETLLRTRCPTLVIVGGKLKFLL
jgi:cytosine/adenosine deaminase-related metal-dependent hydrolase